MASECVNLLDTKCFDKNVAIKFDVVKAFDTLNWDFLCRFLIAVGLNSTFVQWVSSILTSVRLYILCFGIQVGFFECSHGGRGDPLSIFFFFFTPCKGGYWSLVHLFETGKVKAISSTRAAEISSHILLAIISWFYVREQSHNGATCSFLWWVWIKFRKLVNKASHVY